MDDDAQVFLAELEARHGGPITWRTYATWYGNNRGVFREYGVFFYWCEGRFYFEDFERTPSILGIAVKSKTPKKPFVRYEGSFASSDVVLTRQVPKSVAHRNIDTKKITEKIREVTFFDKVFRQMVEMVVLSDGTIHFFELMNRKEFLSVLNSIDKE